MSTEHPITIHSNLPQRHRSAINHTNKNTMPRFLSRSPATYKKHPTCYTENASSSSSYVPREGRYANFTAWFEASCMREFRKMSNSSLATLSLSGEQSNESIISKETRTHSPVCTLEELERAKTSHDAATADSSWGQFIDPAETEEKLVRSNKSFPPQRYALYTLDEMSSSSSRFDGTEGEC